MVSDCHVYCHGDCHGDCHTRSIKMTVHIYRKKVLHFSLYFACSFMQVKSGQISLNLFICL